MKPLSPKSFVVQFTIGQSAHDKLRYAQELLSHQIPSGDIAEVFKRALDLAIPQLEQGKFAATERPRTGRPTRSTRHIPTHIRRTVWDRDGGRCTFVSENGHRCGARKLLEFDHIHEVARGGETTVDGIRLRCRAHYQYEAECTFGAEFMRHKRIAAAEARAVAKARGAAARAEAACAEQAAAVGQAAREAAVLEVVPWLRQLGYSSKDARGAAELCREMPGASLEARVRAALSHFHLRGTRVVRAVAPERGFAAAC